MTQVGHLGLAPFALPKLDLGAYLHIACTFGHDVISPQAAAAFG